MHDSAHVCDEMSGILHVNVNGLHPNISAFLFECAVSRFASDELIRAVACTLSPVPPGLPSNCCAWASVELVCVQTSIAAAEGGLSSLVPLATQISSVVTAGETVLFWFLQDSEGAQPLNLSAKPKASESKSPNSPPTSPQVPAAAAGATKLGHAGSGKHSAPSSIGGPPTRMSSIGKWTCMARS